MKKRYKFLGLLGLLPFLATAQLTNSGATIVIEPGAKLVVEGAITNTSGTITNRGTIEVGEDFVNNGTLSSDSDDGIIIFNGSADQAFTSATAVGINELIIDNSENKVSFAGTGTVTVGTQVEFTATAGNLNIGDADLVLPASGTAIVNGDADSYIEADGDGKVVKTYGTTGPYTYPVGDANAYSPVTIDMTTGAGGSTIAVGVPYSETGYSELPSSTNPSRNATDYLKRSWDIEMVGATAVTVTGTYVPGDIVGMSSLMKTAMYDGASWSYDDAANAANTISTDITGDAVVTGSNTFGKGMVQVILGGAYDDASNLMRTDLNDDGILAAEATDSPYTTTLSVGGESESVDAAFFTANPTIVDWIKIELRDANVNTSVLASRSAFVVSDGTIVDIDGTDTDMELWFKNAPASSFIAIRHRNHLGIMLDNTTGLFGTPTTVDFKALAANTFGTNAQQTFDGKLMMWGGDAAGNGDLDYDGVGQNDLASLQNQILSHPSNMGFGGIQIGRLLTNVYQAADMDLDGDLDYDGVGQNELARLQNGILNHTNNSGFGGIQIGRLITAELPEND